MEDDFYRPSIFEMVAGQQLMTGLKPAFAFVFRAVARRVPPLHYLLVACDEEVIYGLFYLLERHFVKTYDASFAENFYGLKRERVLLVSSSSSAASSPEASPLRSVDRRNALLSLIVLPYVRARVDRYYQLLTRRATEDGFESPHFVRVHSGDGEHGDDWLGDARSEADAADASPAFLKVRRSFIRYYPYAYAGVELLLLFYQLRFTFGFSAFFDPWLKLASQSVRRLSFEDMQQQAKRSNNVGNNGGGGGGGGDAAQRALEAQWRRQQRGGLLSRAYQAVSGATAAVAEYAQVGLMGAVFLFKFLEWWHSPQNRLAPSAPLCVPPPPPPAPPAATTAVALPANKTHCPLCRRERSNPATTTTGYVFCYPCIFQYVTDRGRCPVTHHAQTDSDVRKVYTG
jgi:peroxin-12